MEQFTSYRSYRDFAWGVARHRRYIRTSEQLDFLKPKCPKFACSRRLRRLCVGRNERRYGGSSGGHLVSMLGVLDGVGNPEDPSPIKLGSSGISVGNRSR